MSYPKTLLQLASAPSHLPSWEDAALVLIDHQIEYTEGALPLAGVREAVAEIAEVLALARKADAPVFHVIHHGRPGGALFDPERPMVRIIRGLEPCAEEQVIVKNLPNAFAGTALHEQIRETKRTNLVICGFATHMCVSATTRSALDHGYRTTVVANACATRDLPGPLGGIIPADQVHNASLAALADRFATVVPDSNAWR